MGLVTDILKEIPQAAVLKEKLSTIEAKYAAADTENAILRDDLRQARAEITNLKKQIAELTHKDDLSKLEVLLTQLLADSTIEHDPEALATGLNEHPTKVKYHLQRLEDAGYVVESSVFIGGSPIPYYLTQQGREFLVKNNLL